MKDEYVWTCDYCGKEFETKKESDKHELRCPKKTKDSELVIRFKKPNTSQVAIYALALIIFYVIVFGLVDSYAQSNSLPRKDFFDPFSWFSSQKDSTTQQPSPSPTQTPTLTPTPRQVQKTKGTSSSTSNSSSSGNIECIGPDGKHFNTLMEECEKLNKAWSKPVNYMVNCTMTQNCGGDTRRISKLECDTGTCCQVGSTWSFYSSVEKCKQAQSSSGSGESRANYSSWSEVTTNGGNLVLKCSGNIDAVRKADAIHMEAANNYIECLKRESDQSKCTTLKQEAEQKDLAFRSTIKNENCVVWVHQ